MINKDKHTVLDSTSPATVSKKILRIPKRVQDVTLITERLVDWALALLTWFPWTLLVGMLPGVIIWQQLHAYHLRNLFENQIVAQPVIAIYAAISSAIYIGLCFLAYRRLQRGRTLSFSAFCQKINKYATGLLVVPIYLFIRSHPVAQKAPFLTMLLCTGAGIIAAAIVYSVPRLSAVLKPHDGKPSVLPLWIVMTLAAIWAAVIIQLAMTQHAALKTSDWDFGLYINTMWKSLHGDLLGCSLYSQGNHAFLHFDPILIMLSPILLIYPGPESLIVLQGVWVASGAVPLYLLASHYGKNAWLGVAMAIVYLLHPAFHGPAMYDFHSLILAGPLMLWCIHFLEAGATRRFFFFFILLLLTREDMVGIAGFMGLYAFVSGKPRPVALGAMAMAALYGVIIYFAVIYHGNSYCSYFKEMQGENRSVLANIGLTAVSNPMFMLKYMLSEKKLVYILQLIVPVLFLPVFAPKHRILYLCGLGVTLLGAKNCLTNISMQYSTWWLPFMLAAVPTAIYTISQGRLTELFRLDAARFRAALVSGVLLSTLTMSIAYGVFWPKPSFRTGYTTLSRHLDTNQQKRAETVAKIKKMIPPDASVMASQHLVPHFALRDQIWSVDRPGYRVGEPDYAIVWKRDLRSKKEYKIKTRRKNLKMLHDTTRYQRILKENDISLYVRLGTINFILPQQ